MELKYDKANAAIRAGTRYCHDSNITNTSSTAVVPSASETASLFGVGVWIGSGATRPHAK